jgi:hypothetical protein
MSRWIPGLLLAVTLQHSALGSDAPHEARAEGVEALSAPLRAALSQEMVALQNGMIGIVPAFVAGDWALVSKTARKMEESHILRQVLSAEQREQLHRLLPARFLEMDAQFHALAGMLAHAADNRKPELAAFYYSRMLEACTACHTRYATGKFPALAPTDTPGPHDHHH